jgi:hypothetical protein
MVMDPKNEFSVFELRIVRNLATKVSPQAIADILERPADQVADVVSRVAEKYHFLPYDLKVKCIQEKALRVKKKKASLKKEGKKREVGSFRKRRSDQVEIEAAMIRKRKENSRPAYKMKVVDYSKLIPVRIDKKTVTYIQPGEDPVKAKELFLKVNKGYMEKIKLRKEE